MIPLKAKFTAVFMMSISAVYLTFFSGAPNIVIICALGLMVYGATYVMTKPSRVAEKKKVATSEAKENPEGDIKVPTDVNSPSEP